MSELSNKAFAIALQRAWNHVGQQAFTALRKTVITGDELRAYLLEYLERQPLPHPIFRDWLALPPERQAAILRETFPEDQYSAPGPPPPADAEMAELCALEAAEFQRRITTIMRLVESQPLSADAKRQAQELMRMLKERFKEDAATARSRDVARVEKDYHRMVAEAATRIRSAWNSDPVSSKWHDQLYDCRGDFDHYHRHLPSTPAG